MSLVRRWNSPRGRVRGITLTESVMCTLILAISVISVIHGLTFGYGLAKKATRETLTSLRASQRLEEILLTPYDQITTARYPVEYVTTTQKTDVALVWAMTTTVVEVTVPSRYKLVTVYCTWGEGGGRRHTSYAFVRAPVEMRAPYYPVEP